MLADRHFRNECNTANLSHVHSRLPKHNMGLYAGATSGSLRFMLHEYVCQPAVPQPNCIGTARLQSHGATCRSKLAVVRFKLRTTVWPRSTMALLPALNPSTVDCTSSKTMPRTRAYVNNPTMCVMLTTNEARGVSSPQASAPAHPLCKLTHHAGASGRGTCMPCQ